MFVKLESIFVSIVITDENRVLSLKCGDGLDHNSEEEKIYQNNGYTLFYVDTKWVSIKSILHSMREFDKAKFVCDEHKIKPHSPIGLFIRENWVNEKVLGSRVANILAINHDLNDKRHELETHFMRMMRLRLFDPKYLQQLRNRVLHFNESIIRVLQNHGFDCSTLQPIIFE